MQIIKRIIKKNRLANIGMNSYFLNKFFLKEIGWTESALTGSSIDEDQNPIPWFTYAAINFLDEKLNNSMRVFEFGSGNSTQWLSKRVKNVYSVEHNREFYESQKPILEKQTNIDYHFVNEGEYAAQIKKFKNEFDVVIIDGINRVECAYNSIEALKEDGVIIWDNSDRSEYREGFDFLKQNNFKKIDFKGLGPIAFILTQTTIFYRKENCFDI